MYIYSLEGVNVHLRKYAFSPVAIVQTAPWAVQFALCSFHVSRWRGAVCTRRGANCTASFLRLLNFMLFCVCCGVVLRCLWWFFSSFAYRCPNVHMLFLFVFCGLFGCVCVFVVSVCYCLFCVPCLLLFLCAWLFVVFCSLFFQTIGLGETRWHHYSSCSSYRWKKNVKKDLLGWEPMFLFVHGVPCSVFEMVYCEIFCASNLSLFHTSTPL